MSLYSDFIVFADESGDHGLARVDPAYPVFVLAFCIDILRSKFHAHGDGRIEGLGLKVFP